MKQLPGTYWSRRMTEEQIRSKYGKHVARACMQLEEGDNTFLQDYKEYRRKYRKWMPYYYRGVIRRIVSLKDTVCLHVVLLENNSMRDWNRLWCARRIGENQFEILNIKCEYSMADDIKGIFAYIIINEEGNFAFNDYEKIDNNEEIVQAVKNKHKINMIKVLWFVYIFASWAIASLLIVIAHDMKHGAMINIVICVIYLYLLYEAKVIMKKKLETFDFFYVRRGGFELVTAILVLLEGLVWLIK